MLDLLGALAGIVLVDLVLSGDNALVIGAAAVRATRLPPRRVSIREGARVLSGWG